MVWDPQHRLFTREDDERWRKRRGCIVEVSYYRWSEPNGCGRRENWRGKRLTFEDGSTDTEPNHEFLGYS